MMIGNSVSNGRLLLCHNNTPGGCCVSEKQSAQPGIDCRKVMEIVETAMGTRCFAFQS